MNHPAAPCWQVQHNARHCADILHDSDHDLPPADRAHVCLIRGMHPDDIGWLSVVRMFVLYRDVLGDRV